MVEGATAPIYLTIKTFSFSHIDMSAMMFMVPWAILASIMHMAGFAIAFPVGLLVRYLFRKFNE
jgi:hypothetical protein